MNVKKKDCLMFRIITIYFIQFQEKKMVFLKTKDEKVVKLSFANVLLTYLQQDSFNNIVIINIIIQLYVLSK